MGICPRSQGGDLVALVVDADDVVAEVGEDGAGDQTHVSGADDADVHEVLSVMIADGLAAAPAPVSVVRVGLGGRPAEEDDREGHERDQPGRHPHDDAAQPLVGRAA